MPATVVELAPGTWNTARDFTYRWLRNSIPITDATSASYTLTTADVNTTIYCETRAANLAGSDGTGSALGAT